MKKILTIILISIICQYTYAVDLQGAIGVKQDTSATVEIKRYRNTNSLYDDDRTIFQRYLPRAKYLDRGIVQQVFIPKGQWVVGGTMGYSSMDMDDYLFIIIKDIKTEVYTAKIKISALYALKDDIGVGVMFNYNRTQVKIDNANISISEDLGFEIMDYYNVKHVYKGSAFLRAYINIGDSKRFAMFNDVIFSFGGGNGKIVTGTGVDIKGTYEKITTLGLTFQPGIVVFATDFLAVEASVGILGVTYTKTEQLTNQVYQGSLAQFKANFKLNLFSVGIGMSFYF